MNSYLKKILYILNYNQKKKITLLLFLLAAGALFEMIGLWLLIPLISLLTNHSINVSFINYIFFINEQEIFNKLSIICLLIFLIFLLKTIFFTILNLMNTKFISNLSVETSNRVFKNYIFMDYVFFLKKNSSQLIQNITTEANIFCYIFFRSLLVFLIEIAVILSIMFVLILLDFKIFFTVLVLFGTLILCSTILIKNFLRKITANRKFHQQQLNKLLQEGIRDIKNIKITGKENFFLDYFYFHQKKYAEIEGGANFLNALPKYYLEFFGVIIFILTIYTLSFFQISDENILVIIGVFAAATLKLLPSVNRLITALTNIRYGKSALDVIYKEFKLKYKKNYKISFDQFFLKRSINIKNLSFKYSGNNSFIFKNFNLKIPANKIIGIIGESGSGKTTLIDIISGILKPISGEIIVDGIKINKNIRKWQNNIGYVSQSVYLLDDSIRKNIAFGIDDKDINNKKIYSSLDLVNLGNFVRKLPKNIYTSVGELGNNLSGGQKQRLGLARIFYKDFNFLILDEVTNSLDKKNEDYIMNSLNIIKKEKTIIIICHNSNIAKKCDVIIDLNKNKIFKTKILKYI